MAQNSPKLTCTSDPYFIIHVYAARNAKLEQPPELKPDVLQPQINMLHAHLFVDTSSCSSYST
jgi:hypothetical protein